MCGITGWVEYDADLSREIAVLERMTETLAPRGPDASGIWLTQACALGHRRLSVIDPENGAQPMERTVGGHTYVVVYNGELYNASELREELENRGWEFRTHCDTEVLLLAFIEWGRPCVERFNGIFAFAVWSSKDQALFFARDRLGVKPLFFMARSGRLLFGSEPKAILAHRDVRAEVDAEGLAELFAIGPARTPGHGVYKGMEELKPGQAAVFDRDGLRVYTYWRLVSAPHTEDAAATAAKVRELLHDTVQRQLVSDVPVCALLSGGLDSSALTSFAADYYHGQGRGIVHTYSVDYVDNDKFFKANAFQPNADAPWIRKMADHLGTTHHWIQFDTPELVESLKAAVTARDFPGMADVDGSLLLFCREIKKNATVAISGEAADEIFGGYPWFHRKESLEADIFPWALSVKAREELLSPQLADWIKPEKYVRERYEQALDEVPRLAGEDAAQARIREMSWLNITRFMPTLLDRKDRMSMAVGLEVRVPFCDHRLVEYVWNIPWEMKMAGGREKGVLREAMRGWLPDEVLFRKKSPYPKTHNPGYEHAVKQWVLEILNDSSTPLGELVHVDRIRELAADGTGQFQLPWFGQLMTGPQFFAWLGQVYVWLKEYKVAIV